MATVFNLNAPFPAGTTHSGTFTVGKGQTVLEGVASIGPMSDPATHVVASVDMSTDGGATWFQVGGLDSFGGLVSPKGGTPNQPIVATATTESPVVEGYKIRATIAVAIGPLDGASIPVSLSGTVS